MSIIIRNNPGGGSSTKGFPPENVTNIVYSPNSNSIKIKWKDPEDTIVNGTTISKWKNTLLVRKTGSYPTSPTDGTVVINNTTRNNYKDTALTDSGLVNGTTYYYRFYTYNDAKMCNDSSEMMFSIAPKEISTSLSNNTWEDISRIAESGTASDIWNIGDEINIHISANSIISLSALTMTFQIWDFNHFDKSDGSGKAGITFGCKYLMMPQTKHYNETAYVPGGWTGSLIRSIILPNILSSLPAELQSVIKEVDTYANSGYDPGDSTAPTLESMGRLAKDKLFLPGYKEVGGTYDKQLITEKGQTQFPIFTNDASRIKKAYNESGSISKWWTRSACYGNLSTFYCVTDTGDRDNYYSNSNTGRICFCFNV